MILSLWFSMNKRIAAPCVARHAAGRSPASLLGELKKWIAPTGAAFLRIRAGDQREVVVDRASYVLQLAPGDGTDFNEVSAELQ